MKQLVLAALLLSMASPAFAGDKVWLQGRLLDQTTAEPVAGAHILSAYEYSPSGLTTGSDGIFEIEIDADFIRAEGPEAGKKDVGGNWNFFKPCYGYSQFGLQKNLEIWNQGKLIATHKMGLTQMTFDANDKVSGVAVNEKVPLSVGDFLIQPMASMLVKTDKPFYGASVYYKSKKTGKEVESFATGGYSKEFSLSDSLPIGYEVVIKFLDENNKVSATSASYTIPTEARCGTMILNYNSTTGESKWRVKREGFFMKITKLYKRIF